MAQYSHFMAKQTGARLYVSTGTHRLAMPELGPEPGAWLTWECDLTVLLTQPSPHSVTVAEMFT